MSIQLRLVAPWGLVQRMSLRQKIQHKSDNLLSESQKSLFTVKVTKHWQRLPREFVESQSLEAFKNGETQSCYMGYSWPWLIEGVDKWFPEVHPASTILCSVVLWHLRSTHIDFTLGWGTVKLCTCQIYFSCTDKWKKLY